MAQIPPPPVEKLPSPDQLGPDPEPPGVRFERLLARTRGHTVAQLERSGAVKAAAPPRRLARNQHALRGAAGRAHVRPR